MGLFSKACVFIDLNNFNYNLKFCNLRKIYVFSNRFSLLNQRSFQGKLYCYAFMCFNMVGP